NAYATTADFTATIDWGDGVNPTNPSLGMISTNNNGGFNIVGQHEYQNAGPFAITVTITSPGGQATIAISKANVTALPVQLFPLKVTGGANQSLAGVTVATFLDPYSTDTANDFQ